MPKKSNRFIYVKPYDRDDYPLLVENACSFFSSMKYMRLFTYMLSSPDQEEFSPTEIHKAINIWPQDLYRALRQFDEWGLVEWVGPHEDILFCPEKIYSLALEGK